ncbi:MAG: hypothetical protein CL927_13845, partial [Deltaproteobacteria bacterium]|nr:hypothetical protein [Deltaproteobacteria bacterium]
GEPQDGEPQDGEPQDGEPQDGESQDGRESSDASTPPEPTDGTRPEADAGEDTGMSGSMEDLRADGADGAQEDVDDASPSGQTPRGIEGEMTEEEATRTVDSVEEGRPRVVARPDAAGDKDW